MAAGGCSYPIETMFSKKEADVTQTGSIGKSAGRAAPAPEAAPPSEVDLAYARAVAAEALARTTRDISFPWENPHTGAGGNITPLAATHSEGSFTCRDFLASYVRGPSQTWLQGEACRAAHGKWEVKSLRPLSG